MNKFSITKVSFLIGLLFSALSFSQITLADYGSTNTVATNQPVAKTPEEDAKVTNTIKKLISKNKTLSDLNVLVSTNKGVVTLSGNIDSDTQASELVVLAESVIGVSDVDTSKLIVKSSQHPLTDTITTAKIKGLFIREKLFGEKDIAAINTSVETKDGVVYLSGIVDNKEQIDNAIAIIKKSVPEVKKVVYSVKKISPAN